MRHTFVVLLLLCVAPASRAVETDFKFKGTLAGIADGGHDLGICHDPAAPVDPNDPNGQQDPCTSFSQGDHQQGYIDLTPWVHMQAGHWGFFLRAEGYAQTGPVLRPQNENNGIDSGQDQKNYFAGLKEAWVEYGGITNYPGEWLRLGRQRIRQEDGEWWDVDIDAARWVFDTTQFQTDFGAARQFNKYGYRTDKAIEPNSQRDRTFAFGSIGGEWLERNRLTLRALYAKDDTSPALPAVGDTPDPNAKTSHGSLAWIGVQAHDHYFDWKRPPHLGYWLEGIGLVGKVDRFTTDPTTGKVATQESDNMQAYAAEAMGKIVMPRSWPIQFGGGVTYSSGGTDRNKQYFQPGTQSNYSRFTGTRSLIYRYNEAYRAELGNLEAVTGFASIDAGHYDANAIFNAFWRADGSAPVTANGITARPVNGKAELGQGVDLIVSRYFTIDPETEEDETGETTASAIRVRGSVFRPGAAYGDNAKDEYRGVLELVIWY